MRSRTRFQLQNHQSVESRRSYRAAVAVLVLSVHHVIRGGELPPNQLVKQVVESWDETELGQHLVDLQGRRR